MSRSRGIQAASSRKIDGSPAARNGVLFRILPRPFSIQTVVILWTAARVFYGRDRRSWAAVEYRRGAAVIFFTDAASMGRPGRSRELRHRARGGRGVPGVLQAGGGRPEESPAARHTRV